MKRLALVGLALILIATVASAASVTVFDDAARAADDKASTLLRFADEAVLIHADGKTYPGGRLIASGVDANRLALVRDHRAIGERTGYDVLYSRASFQLTVLDEPGALSTGPWLWVERVTADRTVLSAPPKTKATPDPRVEGLVDGLSQSAYDSYLDYLASDLPTRFSCAEEIYDARDLIAAHFAAMGYATQTPTFSQGCVRCERADGHNVVGVKTGRVRPDDWFVVLGHYDSISPDPCDLAPGANDNASGTAGVMEMARLFAGVDTEATLVFLAVAGEEQGMYGSTDWVKDLESAGDLDRVKGFINMDMIAYYASHYEMLIEGADNEAGQAEGLADLALFLTTYSGVDAATTTDYNSSDHVPFLDRGVPGALMIESDWSDYDYYHTTGDTVDKQDTAFAIDGLRGVAAALATWAGLLEASPPATLSALTATEADGPVNAGRVGDDRRTAGQGVPRRAIDERPRPVHADHRLGDPGAGRAVEWVVLLDHRRGRRRGRYGLVSPGGPGRQREPDELRPAAGLDRVR